MSIFNDGLLHVKLDMNKVEKGKFENNNSPKPKKEKRNSLLVSWVW